MKNMMLTIASDAIFGMKRIVDLRSVVFVEIDLKNH
jgi:hypothetical protein